MCKTPRPSRLCFHPITILTPWTAFPSMFVRVRAPQLELIWCLMTRVLTLLAYLEQTLPNGQGRGHSRFRTSSTSKQREPETGSAADLVAPGSIMANGSSSSVHTRGSSIVKVLGGGRLINFNNPPSVRCVSCVVVVS